jgi:class 3 adenylate cyclase
MARKGDRVPTKRELPCGTVTFLFTDIEGSTRLLRTHGEQYVELLAMHRRRIRAAISAHDGVETGSVGDAVFAAFHRAHDAVAAALDAQAALAQGPVLVRMGLHTGEPLVTPEGYVGLEVHRTARITAAGHGGQVLLSQITRHLVDVDVRDLGEHRLKDLPHPERIFQLGQRAFAPLATLGGARSVRRDDPPSPADPCRANAQRALRLSARVSHHGVCTM